MRRDILLERFFDALIGGQRTEARKVVDEALTECEEAPLVLSRLFWPALERIQNLHRADQLSILAFNYATRLLRVLVDQMQLRLETAPSRNRKVLLVCGPEESEEIGAQIACDLLESDGYEVRFAGGGIANDEVVTELGELNANILIVFGAVPSTVPFTRQLIDRLHEIGACPDLQIIVGGGVFNRAEGLAEEIGADLWASTPEELIEVMADEPQRRMTQDQRTVGRKRRPQRGTDADAA